MNEQTQQVVREMVDGMLGNLQASEISRINVVFNI